MLLPSLWPFVAFFYNGMSVSSSRMATPACGCSTSDAPGRRPAPVGFVAAGIHAALLYASWLFPVVFLASLVMPDKRCLHDVAAGVIVVAGPEHPLGRTISRSGSRSNAR